MGYSHTYCYNSADPQFQAAWPRMTADTRTIIEAVLHLDLGVTGPYGEIEPTITDDVIGFNGLRCRGEDRDPLLITAAPPDEPQDSSGPEPGFRASHCETGRNPYDLAVAAVLLRCHRLAPQAFRIDSSGRWNGEWIYGAHHSQLGPTPPFGPSARMLNATLFADAPDESPFTRRFPW
ncbi:MAG: hypothetical protein QOJ50_1416 [Cryptosporangiaceae bacterium]|nr:hypothetical protein [Cryptosporangiaceae bacterium]